MDYPTLLISGSLLILCIALFYLWIKAERRRRNKENVNNNK